MGNIIQPVEVVRDCDGFWTHPDFPLWDEGTPASEVHKWCDDNDLSLLIIHMENDDEGICNCTPWEPTHPDNSFLLSIHDTEDGPVAIYGARLPSGD